VGVRTGARARGGRPHCSARVGVARELSVMKSWAWPGGNAGFSLGHAAVFLFCLLLVFPKSAWCESREQFLHCGLRKFRHSKSSVYR